MSTALQGGIPINPIPMELMMQTITTPLPRGATFLEPSSFEADGGQMVGKDPRQIPVAELRLLQQPESPIKAIRAKCIDCSGNNVAEVRKCTAVGCALWPMRMGTSPFHASSASSKLQTPTLAIPSNEEA
ncbi:hypothetical protein [Devosia sp. 1635]|uniref:hypothetical protein n=1 Tax=Devosia sp. 1635 TaxID=2726066 RepID=UPI001567895B|nr:hypothetical protein [Devosia sp. 1635]